MAPIKIDLPIDASMPSDRIVLNVTSWADLSTQLSASLYSVQERIYRHTVASWVTQYISLTPEAPAGRWLRSDAVWRPFERWALEHRLALPPRTIGLGYVRDAIGLPRSEQRGYPIIIRGEPAK